MTASNSTTAGDTNKSKEPTPVADSLCVTVTAFPVRYAETDQMGIVHHSVYAVWFECGRTAHVEAFGFTYAGLEDEGAWLPLLSLTCTFHRPMKYGQTAYVKTRLIRAERTRLLFGYAVHAEPDGPVCVSGTTEHAWTGPDLKPVNLSRRHPDLFNRLKPMYDRATGE